MTKYVAFIEFESSEKESLANEKRFLATALDNAGYLITDIDLNLANAVQLSEPVPMDNLPNDPFRFPHIAQLMEALQKRGDRYGN